MTDTSLVVYCKISREDYNSLTIKDEDTLYAVNDNGDFSMANLSDSAELYLGNKKLSPTIVDTTGQSITAVMHQKAVTDAINGLQSDIDAKSEDFYGECNISPSTVAKTVTTLNGGFALKKGAKVSVKFLQGHTASTMTLNVDGTGAKNVYRDGSNLNSTMIKASNVYEFIYDGTYWRIVGVDTDTTYSNATQSTAGLMSSDDKIKLDTLNYALAYDYRNGYLVKTSLPAANYNMILVDIIGHTYDSSKYPIHTIVQFYDYTESGGIIQASATYIGTPIEEIKAFRYNGYVYIWFAQVNNFTTIRVRVTNQYNSYRNYVDTITNSGIPNGATKIVTIKPTSAFIPSNAGYQRIGEYSTAIGAYSQSIGNGSVALGQYSVTNGAYSTACGQSVHTSANYQSVFGYNNIDDPNSIFIVGYNQKNLFTVGFDGTVKSYNGFVYTDGNEFKFTFKDGLHINTGETYIGGFSRDFSGITTKNDGYKSLLGVYGHNQSITHFYIGGTYYDPHIKLTPDGTATFKNKIVGSIDSADKVNNALTINHNGTTKTYDGSSAVTIDIVSGGSSSGESSIQPFAGFMTGTDMSNVQNQSTILTGGQVYCSQSKNRFYYKVNGLFYSNFPNASLYNDNYDISSATAKIGAIFSYSGKHYTMHNGTLQDMSVLDDNGNMTTAGIVKLSDSTTGSSFGINNGVAATPKAVASVATTARNYTDSKASQTLESANQYTDEQIAAKILLVPELPENPISGVLYCIPE